MIFYEFKIRKMHKLISTEDIYIFSLFINMNTYEPNNGLKLSSNNEKHNIKVIMLF